MSADTEIGGRHGSGWSVLLEDGPVLAINKPAGLLTQAPAGIPSLEAEVKEWLKRRFDKPGKVYLGIPHRLDRVVSGVILFTRNSKAAARMAEQFEQRQVRKIYWAVVTGRPIDPAGELHDWLRKLPEQSRSEIVSPDVPEARECRLTYRVLATAGGQTLLEVEPQTGRMHQIRIQLASRGLPIVGDAAYGSPAPLEVAESAAASAQPIALHARSLSFQHPIRYEPITVSAPLPPHWPKSLQPGCGKASG